MKTLAEIKNNKDLVDKKYIDDRSVDIDEAEKISIDVVAKLNSNNLITSNAAYKAINKKMKIIYSDTAPTGNVLWYDTSE